MRNLVRALGLAVLPWPAFLYSIQDPGTTQLTVALLLLIVSLLIIVHSAKAAQCVLCQSFYADTMCISADGEQGFPQRSPNINPIVLVNQLQLPNLNPNTVVNISNLITNPKHNPKHDSLPLPNPNANADRSQEPLALSVSTIKPKGSPKP